MMSFALIVLMALASPVPARAATPDARIATRDNAEMAALFDADQKARQDLKPEQFADRAFVTRMIAQDGERRAATRRLLDAGKLATGNDYYAAAFVFQHGGEANDYLLAHSLAIAAVARGKASASWIAAATLDRYLQKIGQKQIYGTQYLNRTATGPTMEPYDRTLISDRLRGVLEVPPQAEQDKRLETMRTASPFAK